MLVCDVDNIVEATEYPTSEVIQRQQDRQTQSLLDIRRRLREAEAKRRLSPLVRHMV